MRGFGILEALDWQHNEGLFNSQEAHQDGHTLTTREFVHTKKLSLFNASIFPFCLSQSNCVSAAFYFQYLSYKALSDHRFILTK